LVIEIGAWMGRSTCTIADALRRAKSDACVLTIDTWLGSAKHWMNPKNRPHLELKNGYPTFYRRFLSNVVAAGNAGLIVPLPMPSQVAAQFLKGANLRAQLIYIDGSHDEKDVYDDLSAFWPLLVSDGVIFGDDFTWMSVERAVRRFSADRRILFEVDGLHWILRKTPRKWKLRDTLRRLKNWLIVKRS
jgi:predicted O-methyltransferase YrrM